MSWSYCRRLASRSLGDHGCPHWLTGSGKSLFLEVVKSFFDVARVGSITSNFEGVFGLQGLYDKDLVIADDLSEDITRSLPQEMLQTMISGATIIVAIKGQTSVSLNWRAP
ncbi:hypothetical protein BJ741DRAFT_120168 [Chytriomyces cf. hyalinus JEL632]|nr:hypothetical protein BJ741DRAFT_120168 [Chytriomyces cf. hyalinus JEL632]